MGSHCPIFLAEIEKIFLVIFSDLDQELEITWLLAFGHGFHDSLLPLEHVEVHIDSFHEDITFDVVLGAVDPSLDVLKALFLKKAIKSTPAGCSCYGGRLGGWCANRGLSLLNNLPVL